MSYSRFWISHPDCAPTARGRMDNAMKRQDAALIADAAGLLTSIAFLLLTFNLVPYIHVPPPCGSCLRSCF